MDNLYNRVSRRQRGEGGFTLIELLVVIAILAILAFIVIFNVTGVTNRGNSSACVTDGSGDRVEHQVGDTCLRCALADAGAEGEHRPVIDVTG